MDFTKIYCPKHKQDIVTNFCNKQQCMVELCASCIGQHTQLHMEKGTNPSYQNIKTTYQNLKVSIQQKAHQLQNINRRIIEVETKAKQKKQKLIQIMKSAQQQSLTFVKCFYQRRQKQLLLQIEYMDKMNGLHCQVRLTSMKRILKSEIQNLMAIANQITCYNFLQNMPKIKMQVLHNVEVKAAQIYQQVTQNQQYNTSVLYNKSLLSEIKQSLNKIVTISISKNAVLLNKNNNLFSFSNIYREPQVNNKQALNWDQTPKIIQKQSKQFTLRRSECQRYPQSKSTIENYYVSKQNENFKNVFQCQSLQSQGNNNNSCSKLILTSKKKAKNQQNIYGSQLDKNLILKRKENNLLIGQSLHQSNLKNYNFTFGSQVYPYNIVDKLKQDQSIVLSRFTDKFQITKNQNQLFKSDLQGHKMKNNLNTLYKKPLQFKRFQFEGKQFQNVKSNLTQNKQYKFQI